MIWDGFTVSIRAPARGATASPLARSLPTMCFNPRPRAGGDRISMRSAARMNGFNPRPRAGGDPDVWGEIVELFEFQSAPPRGGRPEELRESDRFHRVSIRAPARGATSSLSTHLPGW